MTNSFALHFESLDLLKDTIDDHEEITYRSLLSDIFPYFMKSSLTCTFVGLQVLVFIVHSVQVICEGELETQLITALSCSEQTIKKYYLHTLFLSLFANAEVGVLLFQLLFNFMILSFIEKKVGKLKLCLYYFGSGCSGNILNLLLAKSTSISNIGSLGLLAVSLKIEYFNFKNDDYIEYQNYNQSLGLYLYKLVLYSYLVYVVIDDALFVTFYMYVGGLAYVVLTELGSFKLSIGVLVGVLIFMIVK